ncbi:tRNA (adenosine(37)-N6)-threonylcarbamoyltransferase complex dimerization subunit type 1 TsaB [Colwelliaceae bacterium 6471]
MNYLALDASTEACSVALIYDNKIYSRYEFSPQSHSLLLLPMVDSVLTEANCKLQQLDGLIFGQGPGSFTGVRIGVGVAQGLAFSANLKVVGVSTLQAMAQRAYALHQQTKVIAAIDARMSEIYTGLYQLDATNIMQPVQAEVVIPPAAAVKHYHNVKDACGVGTGWDAYSEHLSSLKTNLGSPEILFPHAENMLTIGQAKFTNGLGVSAELAQPVYVRDTVSWKKLPGRE